MSHGNIFISQYESGAKYHAVGVIAVNVNYNLTKSLFILCHQFQGSFNALLPLEDD